MSMCGALRRLVLRRAGPAPPEMPMGGSSGGTRWRPGLWRSGAASRVLRNPCPRRVLRSRTGARLEWRSQLGAESHDLGPVRVARSVPSRGRRRARASLPRRRAKALNQRLRRGAGGAGRGPERIVVATIRSRLRRRLREFPIVAGQRRGLPWTGLVAPPRCVAPAAQLPPGIGGGRWGRRLGSGPLRGLCLLRRRCPASRCPARLLHRWPGDRASSIATPLVPGWQGGGINRAIGSV